MSVLAPHFEVPFRIAGKAAAVVDQDSPQEVAQCVYAVLATERGSRLEESAYGITDPSFRQNGMDLGEALVAINTWEPRAEVETEQEIEDMVARVRVAVS